MTLLRRLVVSAVVVATAAVSLAAVAATPASAADGTMTFDGRGWGHGRGMSQYGAQGYAKNYGWSSGQILNHYYGGTKAGYASQAASPPIDPNYVRIRLDRMAGKQIRVTLGNGQLSMTGADKTLPGGTNTILLNPTVAGGKHVYDVWYSSSASCTAGLSHLGVTDSGLITIGKNRGDTADPNDLIRVCPPTGSSESIWYPGSLRGHISNGTSQAVNITTMERQLRSIVPSESPSSWSAAALQAQAVAARSYALSGDSRYLPYADTCDTIYCQVYRGWFGATTGSPAPTTAVSTDNAIKATTAGGAGTDGLVRLTSTNRIARTEFSSTSGGWTAGGTFPAVEDKGDAISPVHTWRVTVSTAPLDTAYGKGGRLVSVDVTKRNGLGVGGGRVVEAVLRFSNGVTKTVTGNDIRSKLGLRSDWFFPACGSAQVSYLNATFELFVQRGPGANEIQDWCARVGSAGGRQQLTTALSLTDEWAGVQVRALYDKILGRTLDSKGYEYWMGEVRRGVPIEQIAAYFYGGEEYFSRAGSTNAKFLDRLYLDLLGRPSDREGRAYWLPLLDSRRITRTDAATNFYASIESRTSRVHGLYLQILGRKADSSGLKYWTEQLLRSGDIALSSYLAASDEYYKRVT